MYSAICRLFAVVVAVTFAACQHDVLKPIPTNDPVVPEEEPEASFPLPVPPDLQIRACSSVGVEQECYSAAASTRGVGVCVAGTKSCNEAGRWTDCVGEIGPALDTCDGMDNDCDGETDEELGQTQCGRGICRHTVNNCASGETQLCDPMAGAGTEACNGIDDDCDGDIDDGLGDESISCGVGQCRHSVTACAEGQTLTCNPMEGASQEVCDGVDNDCDGLVDEEQGTLACGAGQCGKTVEACIDGVPQVCDPFTGVTAEVCDGVDNDCDGTTDEDQGTLACGSGQCSKTVEACINGITQVCDPFAGATSEACDGADNDCDGATDEGLGNVTCGAGQCARTIVACVSGTSQSCDPFVGATTEVCDGADNDCDGSTDEGLGTLSCGVGQCAQTIAACVGGTSQSCNPRAGASTEVCDGVDNDCDGSTDEGLGTLTCGVGQCAHTVAACAGGTPQVCNPFTGARAEVCDGADNDCDGSTDEDLGSWSCGEGACFTQAPKCVNGQPQPAASCDPSREDEVEVCGDHLDNDCDGVAPPCIESYTTGTTSHARTIDVVWAADGSGSVSEEMTNIERNINAFADVLEEANSSNALHLISDRGTGSLEICVEPPLGGPQCADNAPRFFHYDSNGTSGPMVHSSNPLARIMQQSPNWIPRLQAGSHVAFLIATDDDGDDPNWRWPNDDSEEDDCTSSNYVVNSTTSNYCRWNDPNGATDFTSLANDFNGLYGFKTFMAMYFPDAMPGVDWTVYPIIGATGNNGLPANLQFTCSDAVETGDEYVKLAQFTGTEDSMIPICKQDWDLVGLANSIISNVPQDTFTLQDGVNCLEIDPSTIQVRVNGLPLAPSDWQYTPATCLIKVLNNVPDIGDAVEIDYQLHLP